MALGRLSVLKDYLNIGNTNNDNTLKVYLKAATSVASNYTNRDYLEKPAAAIDEFYSPTDVLNSRLYLRNKPLNTVSAVVENYGKTGGNDTIAAGDYELFSDLGVIRFDDSTLTPGFLNVKVNYQPGYDTSDWDTDAVTATFGNVPEDLEFAVVRIAAKMWLDSKKGDGRAGVKGKSRGQERINFSEMFADDFPKEAELILDGYVMLSV